MLSLAVQTPTLECNGHCISFSLINLLVCHCVSCSCSPFEIHLSINFCLMPQSNHAKHNQSQQQCSRRAELCKAVGQAPDSDGQIPISGNSTERIHDPGMSSQIPQIGEYQSMAHRKLRPPVLNVAPIVLEGSHSLTSPNGLYNLFSFSPPSSDIPCIIYSSQCCL